MKHQWKWYRTFDGEIVEYIRACERCGYEDPGEDPLPECPEDDDVQPKALPVPRYEP